MTATNKNPFSKTIKFTKPKPNHFYAVKDEKGNFVEEKNPQTGQQVYEIPVIAGGEAKKRLLLEIPIPLCQKHFDSHNGQRFGVRTCNGWQYIAIPVELGSTICRECRGELFNPIPYLRSANLRSANLYSANLRSADLSLADLSLANLYSANLSLADLRSADLSSADLRSARNINEALNLDKAYWNQFTKIDDEFKKLLLKDRFRE